MAQRAAKTFATEEQEADAILAVSDPLRASLVEIAGELGLTPRIVERISEQLDGKFLPLKRALSDIGNHDLRDMFKAQAWRILAEITDKDITKAGLRDKMLAAKLATEQALLLDGQPTQILSMPQLENLDALSGMLLAEAKRRGQEVGVNEGNQNVLVVQGTRVGTRSDPAEQWPDPDSEPR